MNSDLRERLIGILGEMGLSAYEAKAFSALLAHGPSTRYELARFAHVPTPKIYETVHRLSEKGFVTLSAESRPRVRPLEPNILLERLRLRQESTLSRLDRTLEDVQRTSTPRASVQSVWTLVGPTAAFDKASEIINRARRSVYFAGFSDDLARLREVMESADKRGVAIVGMSYGASPIQVRRLVEHGDAEGLVDRTGGRWLALVCDHNEVLVSYPMDGECESVWTNSPVLSLIICKYIDEHFFKERPIHYRDPEASGGANHQANSNSAKLRGPHARR